MPASLPPDPQALRESSFHTEPTKPAYSKFARRDDYRGAAPAAEPLKRPASSVSDDAADSHTSSQNTTKPASPDNTVNGTDSGLPPTPPSNSQDTLPRSDFSPPPHADGLVSSLLSKKSTLSTPVNQRSPPTPDASPPHPQRTTESMAVSTPERPILFAYPSSASRPESFKTAREDTSTTENSRSSSPSEERLSNVEDIRGLGLAFESEDNDVTPRNTFVEMRPQNEASSKDVPDEDSPNREKDMEFMRNVTIRRKRNPKSSTESPQKNTHSTPPASLATGSTHRRSSSLRERVQASKNSPHTPEIEHFAKKIGWPTDGPEKPVRRATADVEQKRLSTLSMSSAVEQKRLSTLSMSSAVVEAMVTIVTPPERNRTLRHSGKNLAYVRHASSPIEYSSHSQPSRNSSRSDQVPFHRLVHKRASIASRRDWRGIDSDTIGERSASALSISKQRQDSAAATIAHQDALRRIIQPAADIMSRSNSAQSYHRRMSSAPEPSLREPSLRRQPSLREPSLRRESSLRESSLRESSLRESSLRESSLRESSLRESSLRESSLRESSLRESSLRESSLRESSLRESSLRESSLRESSLRESSLGESASPDLHTSIVESPPNSPAPRKRRNGPSRLTQIQLASPTSAHFEGVSSPESSVETSPAAQRLREPRSPVDMNKSLPQIPLHLPTQPTSDFNPRYEDDPIAYDPDEKRPSSTVLDRVRILLADQENTPPQSVDHRPRGDSSRTLVPSMETAPKVRRGSSSARERSEERKQSSHSQDQTSTSPNTLLRLSSDRLPTEEMPRTSHEWHSFHAGEHGRISFDRLPSRTEEHANARHLYSQSTPFSVLSDTPFEVSEATAVSIYPHNNHSLLVVQQLSRSSTQPFENSQAIEEIQSSPSSHQDRVSRTPPFVDARETPYDQFFHQPTLTFEPSTPPMRINLPTSNGVDSPLLNPRKPPEPPVIQFIPPTPAEELERPLMPGPPKHSNSYPQRRLSLKQRARRYSDNIITPFFTRASIRTRVRAAHSGHDHPQVPTVNDNDNALHPFWRPRGFWDGFEDSDSESEDDFLPRGGDTSDVEDTDSESEELPRKRGVLSRRLTNGFKRNAGGFLIGNSLGVERSGTNHRRPRITLPSKRLTPTNQLSRLSRKSSSPKILVQPPTFPIRAQRLRETTSRDSLNSTATASLERRSRRDTWRKGKKIPGLKNYQLQYIGLSGVKDRVRERNAEKRRDKLRKSIGGRWYVEPANVV